MQNVLTLESNKYAIKIENFEGPLDLLCHLIDKNKMDIYDIRISEIADQYIKKFRENYLEFSKRFFKFAEIIELPKQKLEVEYTKDVLPDIYKKIIERNNEMINVNAKNIEKIAISETYTVGSKVKEMFKELIRKPKFVFNKLYSLSKCNKQEVVTAFSGLLEMSRRNKIVTEQNELFGDITVEKAKK